MTTASFSNFSPYTSYVQSGGEGPGMSDQQFLSGQFLGLFAGPPRLSHVGGALAVGAAIDSPETANQIVYPVGLVQQFSLSQNKQIARVYELGSERSYWIPGRTFGQINMGRVMYHGPSILRTLYAYYQDLLPPTIIPSLFPNVGAASVPNQHDVRNTPGYENFFINLASDLFNQPIGLLMLMRDSNEDTYGSAYFEACVIPQQMISTDAQGVMLQESAGLQFERLVPIATRSIELIS